MNRHVIAWSPLVVILTAAGWLSQGAFPYSEREHTRYSPGDCLRTPIVNPSQLERWEKVPEPEKLVMVTEVGNQHYRLKEWGTRRTVSPQWYAGYDNADFTVLDNQHKWQRIPCPEQGPDPEVASVETSATFVSGSRIIRLPSGTSQLIITEEGGGAGVGASDQLAEFQGNLIHGNVIVEN